MNAFIQHLSRPLQIIGDGLEFRRLRRQLPSVHRRLISTPRGIRTETDAEYLERLRRIYDERSAIHGGFASRSGQTDRTGSLRRHDDHAR
jgi:hypothetical protein